MADERKVSVFGREGISLSQPQCGKPAPGGSCDRGMTPADPMRTKKDEIVRRCFHRVAETYPEAIGSFLKKEIDSFVNPVGPTGNGEKTKREGVQA
ncbi:MAG: hypothetical protein ABSC55_07635 [Syntrophorhabdales bacterium]